MFDTVRRCFRTRRVTLPPPLSLPSSAVRDHPAVVTLAASSGDTWEKRWFVGKKQQEAEQAAEDEDEDMPPLVEDQGSAPQSPSPQRTLEVVVVDLRQTTACGASSRAAAVNLAAVGLTAPLWPPNDLHDRERAAVTRRHLAPPSLEDQWKATGVCRVCQDVPQQRLQHLSNPRDRSSFTVTGLDNLSVGVGENF